MDNTTKNINVINMFDLIKSCNPNQLKVNREVDTIFESNSNEAFVVLKNDKCYCLNQKDSSFNIHCIESGSSLHVVSLAFNKNCIFFVKNNGECYISNGVDSGVKGYTLITQIKLGEVNLLTLKNSSKLLGGLNKKYIVKVVCGEEHALFLTHAGMVFALGENSKGQLGIGSTQPINEASMLSTLLDFRITDIFAGSFHNIAYGVIRDLNKKTVVKQTDEECYLFTWGDNTYGQLGLDQSYTIPTKVDTFANIGNKEKGVLPSINSINGGANHSLVLFNDGKFFAFGDNQYRQANPNSNKAIINLPTLIEFDFMQKNDAIHDIKSGSHSVAVITNQMLVVIYGKIFSKDKKIIKLNTNAENAILTLTDKNVCLFYWGNNGIKHLYTEEKEKKSVSPIIIKSSTNTTSINPGIKKENTYENDIKKCESNVVKNSEGFLKPGLNKKNIKERDRYQSSSDASKEEKSTTKTEGSLQSESGTEENIYTHSSSNKNVLKNRDLNEGLVKDNSKTDLKSQAPTIKRQSDNLLQTKEFINERQQETITYQLSVSKQLTQAKPQTTEHFQSATQKTQYNEQQKDIEKQEINQPPKQQSEKKEEDDKQIGKIKAEPKPQQSKIRPQIVYRKQEKVESPSKTSNTFSKGQTQIINPISDSKSSKEIRLFTGIEKKNSNEDLYTPTKHQSTSQISNKPILNTQKPIEINNKMQTTPITINNLSDSSPNKEDPLLEISVEQSMLELSSFMHVVSPSDSLDKSLTSQNLSFRPKNLPKKTQQEEEYHRSLVEENKRKYLLTLKEKQEKEIKAKKRIEDRKRKQNELERIWKTEIIPDWFNKKKDHRTKSLFYEGIPVTLRGKVWLLSLGNTFSITREYYEIELKNAIEIYIQSSQSSKSIQNDKEQDNRLRDYNIVTVNKESSINVIDLDIERTFPYLGIFKANSPISEDLREILRAFVASRPDIGYVQGLSFIAGILLLNMDKFQSYVALMNLILNPNIIPFYRFEESAIRTRIQLFKQIFYLNLPELCDHFESLDILPEHYFIEWNMTLFCKNVNIDIATRIWDIYMIEGIKAIYQAAIVFLSHYETKFLQMEFEEILKTLKSLHTINFDEDQVISSMKRVNFPNWILLEITKLNNDNIPLS